MEEDVTNFDEKVREKVILIAFNWGERREGHCGNKE